MKTHKLSKEKKSKLKIKKNMVIIILLQLTFLILIIFSSIKLYKWNKDNKANEQILKDISNLIVVLDNEEKNIEENIDENNQENKYKINFEELKKINSDIVAWIKVNNTKIEYPIVKSKNNCYYLNHNLEKIYNIAGWIFADYRNEFNGNDKNIIIYGHNRRDGSMFCTLKDILNQNWYNNDENRNIIFATENEVSTYRVFSIYQIKEEDYYIQTKFTQKSFKEFIEILKKRSIKDFNEEVNQDSKILTLSTCANNNENRVVLHAVKIEE